MSEVPLWAISEWDIETGHVHSTLFRMRGKRPLLDTLYMYLNFEYTVTPGLHYMYICGSRKGSGRRRGGVASIKDVHSCMPH